MNTRKLARGLGEFSIGLGEALGASRIGTR